jgi:ribosomal protein S18 acetylase RimI-like enzyme
MHIRQARVEDAAAIAKVHVDAWRTTYPGIVPADYLVSLSYEHHQEKWRNGLTVPEFGEFTYVAESDRREIVGFATGGPERSGKLDYRGELHAIYLAAGHRRRGIGRSLVRTVAERLVELQFDSIMVWVLADNPSRAFYEALGGEKFFETVVEIGGARMIEVAYGWKPIGKLIERTQKSTRM